MLRTALILAAATAVLLAAPAFAEDQSGAPSQPSTDNPMLCKTQQAATGSRLGARKICMTRNEWRAQQENDRSAIDQAQSSSLRACAPGDGGGCVN